MRLWLLLWLVLTLGASPVWAGDFAKAAAEVQADLNSARQESTDAQARLIQDRARLKERLVRSQKALQDEEKLFQKNQAALKELHQAKTGLSRIFEKKQRRLKELEGLVRASARDLLTRARRSPVTAEDPSRLAKLRAYLDKERYPGLKDLKALIDLYLADIQATGQISARTGALVNRAGQEVKARIVRLGGFSTIYAAGDELGFAIVGHGTGRLLASPAEPSWAMGRVLTAFLAGESDSVYLDISRGAALSRLSRQVGFWEHLLSGGPLVWPILLVALAALILIIERVYFLSRVHANTDVLMAKVNRLVAKGDVFAARAEAETQAGRPTSNVILAGLGLRGNPTEVVESGLSEAMLRELPRLERFITVLKVLAAVAPLLGLLGTVTGMINTFHVITAFGAGNPRLMAGGISEALVTTQLGLAVAIPIMLAAALLGRKAQRITGDMEEKAVALSAALSREAA